MVSINVMLKAKTDDSAAVLVADLFEQYHNAIFAYLYRLTGDKEWAHDLTQDTFLQLFRTRDRLDGVRNQRAWIYRMASNLAFNAIKRRKRFVWLPWGASKDLIGHTPAPDAQVGERDAIAQAMNSLDPTYRAPLLLYTQSELSVREVAKALNISEGAVKNRLYRARKMFQLAWQREQEA